MKAFPSETYSFNSYGNRSNKPTGSHQGMDLRDYFAAKAMQGAIIRADGFTFEQRAEWSYMQADAMMKAREQK